MARALSGWDPPEPSVADSGSKGAGGWRKVSRYTEGDSASQSRELQASHPT